MGRQLDELSVFFSGDPPFMSHHCVIVLCYWRINWWWWCVVTTNERDANVKFYFTLQNCAWSQNKTILHVKCSTKRQSVIYNRKNSEINTILELLGRTAAYVTVARSCAVGATWRIRLKQCREPGLWKKDSSLPACSSQGTTVMFLPAATPVEN